MQLDQNVASYGTSQISTAATPGGNKQQQQDSMGPSLGVFTPDSSTNSVHSIHAGFGGGGGTGSQHPSDLNSQQSNVVMESPNSISSVECMGSNAGAPPTPTTASAAVNQMGQQNVMPQQQQQPYQESTQQQQQQQLQQQQLQQQQQVVPQPPPQCAQQQSKGGATAAAMHQQHLQQPHASPRMVAPAPSPHPQSIPSQS